MSELEAFEAFFKKMGVPYEKNFGLDHPVENKHWLTVSQAHFQFTPEFGNFIGVEADEMGGFKERVTEERV
jgi:hypothetical protein